MPPKLPDLPSGKPPGLPRHAQRLALALFALIPLGLTAACGDDDRGRGDAVGVTDVATLTKADIDRSTGAGGLSQLSGPALCDVAIKQVVYETVGAKGEAGVQASAALLVPGGAGCSGPFPLVAYTKGTDFIRARTLASATDPETALLVGMLAARGYAVVATDYIGFARSEYPYHPYLNAESEAASNLDAIRVAQNTLPSYGAPLNGNVLLTGYSQGGHSSMATQRLIERDAPNGVRIAAAGHSSGPYNLTGSFLAGIALLPAGTVGSSGFVPYTVTGYQKTYGNVYAAPTDYFKEPYATGIESFFPGTLGLNELYTSGRLPVNIGDLVTDRFVADLQNPQTGLRQALDANTLLGYVPRSPTLLCGGARDPVVLFKNAQDAQSAFQAAGVAVSVVDVEQVAAYAPFFPPVLTAEQLLAYHGTTVPPLCMKVVRDQLFEVVGRQP